MIVILNVESRPVRPSQNTEILRREKSALQDDRIRVTVVHLIQNPGGERELRSVRPV